MPKKKKQVRNGFYWYMQDLIPELRREGHNINGIATVVPLAHPRWKALSPENKEIYEEKARVEKRKEQQKGATTAQNPRDTRMDNVGQLIASRVSPEEAALKRRANESRYTKSKWPQGSGDAIIQEMLDYKFYFVAFEYLCEHEENNIKRYYPMEIGVIEYSMRSGITKKYHRHIKPAPIPLGFRYECMHHSEETHQIPVEGHEEADDNYLGIHIQLENFVNPNGTKGHYPPMYTLGTHLECSESCMQWLYEQSNPTGYQKHASRIKRVFELENMVVDLVQMAGETTISRAPVLDVLSSCAWDYEANTRCAFHEEMGNKHCALYSVQNWAYLLSDFLADIYKFQLIPGRHQPEPADHEIVAIPPQPELSRAPRPAPRPSSYSSLMGQGDGSFGGRDIRQDQERFVIHTGNGDSEDDSDSGTDYDSVLEAELSQSGKKNEVADSNHSMAGMGRGAVLPPSQNGGLGFGRGMVTPSVDDDDEFPALGAPGPTKPRQHHAPAPRFAGPPPSSASVVSSSIPESARAPSVISSVTSSQIDSDEESDVLSRRPAQLKSLQEAVKEKEMAEKMRKKPMSTTSSLNEPKTQNIAGPGAGRGTGPRPVNVSNTSFKPTLGNISLTANVGQGRGALLPGGSVLPPGGRGRGRGGSSATSVTSFASSQDSASSRAVPRMVNANSSWAGVGRGIGVAPSETSSLMSGYSGRPSAPSSAVADDVESLASSSVATASYSQSSAGRGRGVWTAKKKPVQPPPGFGVGLTLAEKLQQKLEVNDKQFEDAQGS